jgi:hypothetical protein
MREGIRPKAHLNGLSARELPPADFVTPTDFVTPADFVTPTDFVTPAPEPGSMTSSALRKG